MFPSTEWLTLHSPHIQPIWSVTFDCEPDVQMLTWENYGKHGDVWKHTHPHTHTVWRRLRLMRDVIKRHIWRKAVHSEYHIKAQLDSKKTLHRSTWWAAEVHHNSILNGQTETKTYMKNVNQLLLYIIKSTLPRFKLHNFLSDEMLIVRSTDNRNIYLILFHWDKHQISHQHN